MDRQKAKTWLKLLAPATASIGGLVALRLLGPEVVSQQRLAAWIAPLGDLAPLAFILFLAVRPLTLLPGQIFTAVGGILFGAKWAALYAITGDSLAIVLVFALSRRFGTRLMQRIAKDRYEPLTRAARRHDLKFAMLATINPLIPTDIAIAVAAAAGGRAHRVILGVIVATFPGIYLTAQFGSALSQGKVLLTVVSASGMLLSLALGVVLGRRIYREVSSDQPHPAHRKPARISAGVHPHRTVPRSLVAARARQQRDGATRGGPPGGGEG